MSFHELNPTRSTHLVTFDDSAPVVTRGAPGRIVSICLVGPTPDITVEFSPPGVQGATIVLAGLNDHDVCISRKTPELTPA